MASTGEPDRKRRQLSSISPTATAAKKQPFLPFSEDKKLDTAVLQYQNQKLVQQLEAQKVEYSSLENKFCQLKEKQSDYDGTLLVVNRSWEQLVEDLESCSLRTRNSVGSRKNAGHSSDGASSPAEDAFLERLLETGATDSCSANDSPNHFEDYKQISSVKTTNILRNIVAAINDLWFFKDGISGALLEAFAEDEPSKHKASIDLQSEVKNLRMALGDLHLKHKKLASEVRSRQDTNAKNKAEFKRLTGELECTFAELGESNSKLATLKAQRDAAQSAFFPVLNVGGRHVAGDKARDRQRDLQDMEATLKELSDLTSCRLVELKDLHKERIEILKQLSYLQNSLKGMKQICSSNAYLSARDQLEKSKAEVIQYQSLFKKLQVEKDNFVWWEKEVNIKVDLADIFRRASAIADSRMGELEKEIQERVDERNLFEARLKGISREPGRKEIIAEFKALVSSLPKDMGIMQSQLNKYKEAASEVHSIRAEVQSLSIFLDRKVSELDSLSCRSADQDAEIQKLQAVVHDLKESDQELKLILEMYRRESTDSRNILEARDLEYKAWAHVQSLKSSLDEHSLELRVKAANEAEAISQQKLAAAEAEIADLRQKLEASGSDISKLTEILKSKHEEGEAYLSEIESIGQAYEDMQTQNQHLLQQITERDDYNIKVVITKCFHLFCNPCVQRVLETRQRKCPLCAMSFGPNDVKAVYI
ncbi:E3 ubiquitin-protein ligase BRE1-like 1 isoform X2 [Telopea speciosissima]|uniref:E3 ubiquitin-protein ligase BRE1-like 1 isoform X2 n=1 Tax=Telopea speciosissima TaxID=54955 RepID=UPI001CC5A0A0|nr:E3 ubiquitin-protein ligase BRE1-like 1 isoform X2 [Telopea speciosissima]